MFNRANLTPVQAVPKAFGTSNLQRSPATICSHGPVRLSLRAGSMGRLLQQKSCRNGSQSRGYSAGFTLKQRGPESVRGFTLAELLVTMSVLVLLVLLFTQLLHSAATTMTLGHKRMDADSQARQLLDRMAIDFDQMVKRTDVSYYVKTGTTQPGNQPGNDQIAFFSAVPGYYSQDGYNSNASLVAYRVNNDSTSTSYNKLQRMGKGLAWNGAYATSTPLLFLDGTSNTTIQGVWCQATISGTPSATCTGTPDPDYEISGTQVFRFEYYYLLTSGALANQLSAGPWSNVNSFVVKDVAAIVVAIAVIEPKSKVLLTTANMEKLAGTNGQTSPLVDFTTGWVPGQLLFTWQTALDGITDMPRPAISGIRLYERYFYVNQ
jgi:prepilin-type N-terminal cleavage/methylation domain-containing protein